MSDKINIEGNVNLTELTKSLQEELPDNSSGVELEPIPARGTRRIVLEVGALLAVAKGLAALTPLILGVLNYLKSGKEPAAGDKAARRLVIVAQDNSTLEVPADTSADKLKELLAGQPKFQEPKSITIV
jgi:hypothetical protein